MSDEVPDFDPAPPEYQNIRVKWTGRCTICGDWIFEGELAEWAAGEGMRHHQRDALCIVKAPDGTWRYAS